MNSESKLYVRLVEGTHCYVPLPVNQVADGVFRLLPNDEFDPEDTSTLFEFLPGDDVRAAARDLHDGQGPFLLATELVHGNLADRDYWAVLFSRAWGEEFPSGIGGNRLAEIASRIRSESDTGARWHYPSVLEWARSMA